MRNHNSFNYLEKVQTQIIENLKEIAHCPSVQMQDVPREPLFAHATEEEDARLDDLEEDILKDTRHNPREWDKHIESHLELEGSDGEEDIQMMKISTPIC
jgi:histone deacetylase 1/2